LVIDSAEERLLIYSDAFGVLRAPLAKSSSKEVRGVRRPFFGDGAGWPFGANHLPPSRRTDPAFPVGSASRALRKRAKRARSEPQASGVNQTGVVYAAVIPPSTMNVVPVT
jgi:hypothetical protein